MSKEDSNLVFLEALQRISKTPDGEIVLNGLKETYVDVMLSGLAITDSQKLAGLAQKELVQELLNLATLDLEKITQTGDINE